MNTLNELSIVDLILNASIPVQVIMGLLVFMSILSWALIIGKYFSLQSTHRRCRRFRQHFTQSQNLSQLDAQLNPRQQGPMARIFQAGFKEFAHSSQHPSQLPHRSDNTQRAMRVAAQEELAQLDNSLNALASIGSVSPYIGLLGTVWGIMHAFLGLSTQTTSTLNAVAPGIAEALIATAIGLFAAIPAVLAYNAFTTRVDALASEFDNHIDLVLNALHRHQG